MLFSLIISALSGGIAAPAVGDDRLVHPDWGVDNVAPKAAITRVVGPFSVSGFFVPDRNACNVTLMVAGNSDESLATPPMRLAFAIAARDSIEFQADKANFLRLACTADARAVQVATYQNPVS